MSRSVTSNTSIAALADAMTRSELLTYVQQSQALFDLPFYPLSTQEIEKLKRHGNTAEQWENVRKTRMDAHIAASRIRDCHFQGKVVLGLFDRDHEVDGVTFPSGCYRSTLKNVLVLDNALVKDTTAISNAIVDAHASVIACGSITCAKKTAFGNGVTLSVGVEIGGRDLRVFAELPFDVAREIAGNRADTNLLEEYNEFVQQYTSKVTSRFTLVSRHARLLRCPRVDASFIGSFAVVEDSDVHGSSILSTQSEPSRVRCKSIVRDSIVQWNSVVEDLSFVERGFLCDASHVGRHGIVMSSLLGPNTSIAEGEVTSCFVGPFVGFHHQALLIASYWPEGKGNVGYGANVGSNHTLKAPDQELFPGEGVFFGLGCCVKFPSNFTKAPYSVIATGVATLPQSVEMPFALINTAGHNIPALSPAINEISPGWVLAQSVFTVLRNESKFATRNKSKRTSVSAAIFRPEIVQYMTEARKRLGDAAGKAKIALLSGEAIYTDRQVAGLGKNYMREASRVEAISAYTFFIHMFALDGLLQWLESQRQSNQPIPTRLQELPSASYELETLKAEFPPETLITDALKDLVQKRRAIVKNAISGKSRDDARGKRIIPDYALVHSRVEDEAAVRYAQGVTDNTEKRVSTFISKL
ncbi:hypothetical protein Poli38472_013283 [Pythium oligandrum]|uniref:DUF4954 domain-containing protein n=1 Tax=Pythium oligandrum TaxID=41045 RepID=A0A8K1C3D3_PYTOL|nr:hypothetical protein Poli38472_013283 [Pythium oligandrum]|eukprot:TMW55392.1 hypothetical protein Poli38472_013283 [Pythium oligandrum]